MAKKGKQQHQRAAKRAERQRKREARAQRHRSAGHPAALGGVELVEAFSPSPLAVSVSGRVTLAFAARLGARESAWIFVNASLLGRGYKGSLAIPIPVAVDELLEKGPPLGSLLGGTHVAIPVEEARRLAWGAYVWSLRRGVLGDGEGFEPGAGALAPPSGRPADWEEALEAYFDDGQLELADRIAASVDPWKGAPSERPDVEVLVRFACHTEQPITLAAAIDAHPLEFVLEPGGPRYAYYPVDAEPVLLTQPRAAAGFFALKGDLVLAGAPSAGGAAVLAGRLEQLAPSPLELEIALWEPAH